MFNQLLLLFLNYARYKRGAAYERAEDSGEDSDDEIDDGFPVYFHDDYF